MGSVVWYPCYRSIKFSQNVTLVSWAWARTASGREGEAVCPCARLCSRGPSHWMSASVPCLAFCRRSREDSCLSFLSLRSLPSCSYWQFTSATATWISVRSEGKRRNVDVSTVTAGRWQGHIVRKWHHMLFFKKWYISWGLDFDCSTIHSAVKNKIWSSAHDMRNIIYLMRPQIKNMRHNF